MKVKDGGYYKDFKDDRRTQADGRV